MARVAPTGRFLFDFTRAANADAMAVELADGDHDYLLRAAGQGRPDVATLRWSERLREHLAALREHAESGVGESAARVGRALADFVNVPGQASALRELAARGGGEPVSLTVRSAAAELYLLPWELLTLEGATHAASLARLLIRYEWPDTRTAAPPPGLSVTARGRVVFAWSAAGGKVDAARHVRLIEKAVDSAAGSFEDRGRALDVLENASCESLHACLERAREAREPVAVLHLLCHGGADREGSFGLVLCDGDDPAAPDVVSASRLQQLLAPYAGLARLVVLSACDGGNAGDAGDALGSVAQALHRAGFPVVIASRLPLSWDGARVFAAELYERLLGDLASVEDAFLAARAKLSRRPSYDWASLQLYAREADGDAHQVFNARPYRGLAAFAPEHARFFFGREAEVDELVADLDALCAGGHPRFMVVAGASGTGKSSLVMAGALPRWARGTADGRFDHVIVRPGARPEEAVARVAARLEGARACLRFAVAVDQFEELFTHDAGAEAAARFARALWEWATDPDGNACVILTLRVDFLARCAEVVLEDSGLRLDKVAADPRHQVIVAQMAPAQLLAAIERPARAAGLRLEEGLAQLVVRDVEAEPGALPLMSHALYLLWRGRSDAVLTRAAYQGLGAVSGALNAHAEQVMAGLPDDASRDAARRLMLRLVRPGGDGAPDARRRRLVAELRPAGDEDRARFDRALEGLVGARLLTTSGGGDGGQAVEIAHEALIRNWARLREWLDEERAKLARLDQLDHWAADWRKNPDALLTGSRLAQGEEIAAAWWGDLSEAGRALVEASRAERRRAEAEQARARRARRAAVTAAFAALSGFTGLSWWQVKKTQAAEARSESDEARRKKSDTERERAVYSGRVLELRVRAEEAGVERADLTEALRLRGQGRAAGVTGVDEVLFQLTATVRTRTTLRGLGGSGACVRAVFSADGRRALTATEGGAVEVWDVATGEPVASVDVGGADAGAAAPAAAAISPDGSRVAALSADRRLCVGRVGRGALRCVHAPGRGERAVPPPSVAFSPDGARVVTADGARVVLVWGADDPAPPRVLAAGFGAVWAARFAPSGRSVLGEGSSAAWLWDLDAPGGGARARALQQGAGGVSAAAFAATGARVAVGYPSGTIRAWDVGPSFRSMRMTAQQGFTPSCVVAVAFAPDGDTGAALTDDGRVQVFSAAHQVVTATLPPAGGRTAARRRAQAPASEPAFVRFSPDGAQLLVAVRGVATLWNVRAQRELATFGEPGHRVFDAWFAAEGDFRLLVNSGDAVSVWSTRADELVETRWAASPRVALSVSGLRAASIAAGRLTFTDLDPAAGGQQEGPQVDSGTFAAIAPDGRRVLLVDPAGRVRMVGWGRTTVSDSYAEFRDLLSAALDAGAQLVGGYRSGYVAYVNASPAAASGFGEAHVLGRHARAVNHLTFSPNDPARFASASADGAACLWRLPPPGTRDSVRAEGCAEQVGRHAAAVNTVAFSPDGEVLLTASDDGSAGLWSVARRQLLRYLRGHAGPVLSANFSPDGRRVVTSSRDGTFRVWEANTGRCLAALDARIGPLRRARFAAAGGRSYVVTMGTNGAVRLWTLDGDRVERAARAFLGDGGAPAATAGP